MTGRPVEQVEVRTGAYHDSVRLMQVSRDVAAVPGVLAAQVAMGTDLNRDVLAATGFAVPGGVGPNDLLVALRTRDGAALAAALAAVEAALAPQARPAGSGPVHEDPPRTVGAASRAGGSLALISVPGEHAFVEAMDALEAGLDVMLFSDNVPLAQEVRLKDEAAARGLLVMGPDCGTAVVSGVGLGFANVVRPGPVGVVAASGTGAQQVLCLLDAAGIGVGHCLGVGGRDLSAEVGGRSTRQALAMLDDDPATELIVVVSKPPAAGVREQLAAFAAGLSTPVQLALLGPGEPDLTAAARAAVLAAGGQWQEPRSWPALVTGSPGQVLLGAFAGGTLADEAMLIASAVLGPIPSNIPLAGAPRLDRGLRPPPGGPAHVLVDFGDDELTRGRPHPMIDGGLRSRWIADRAREAAAGSAAVLLLDVVLGHGAHPDPAAELAPVLQAAVADAGPDRFCVVVSLCGSAGDPQGLDRQAAVLQAAGASVHLSNAAAARAALDLMEVAG